MLATLEENAGGPQIQDQSGLWSKSEVRVT